MSFRTAILFLAMQSLAVGAGNSSFILNNGENGTTTLSADINRTVLRLDISEIDYVQTVSDGRQAYAVSLPDQFGIARGAILGEGEILIPTVTRSIAIPFDSNPKLIVTASHFVELPGITLARASDEELASYVNDDRSMTAVLQSEPVIGDVAGEMRDIRIYSITFAPVQYDRDNSILRVYDNIEVEIEHSGSRLTRFEGQLSEAFLPIYRSILDNIAVFDPLEATRGAYWIIYPAVFFDHLQEFSDWKQAKGFDIEYIPEDAIGSNPTYTTIRNYIADRFDTCLVKPDYINIVADVTMPSTYGIVTKTYDNPHGQGDIESDNFYTFLFGNDYFPDILIGRTSIDYASDIDNYKAKFFSYERTPYMGDTGWYLKGTMVAGGENGNFESPMMTKLWCRDRMLDANFTRVDTIFEYYWGQVQPSVITNSINAGVSYVNYRGWGQPSGWYSPDYSVYDLNGLSNGPRYPVMTSIVCGTGDYNDYTDVCFGEGWIRYANKGGPGFIGNSNPDAHTSWTNTIDVGIYWGWFIENVPTITQGQLMGKMAMYNAFPSDRQPNGQVELYFNSYNVLGDPELNCWTDIPKYMTVLYDDSVEVGENHINVLVEDATGIPLEGAYVCLWKAGDVFTGEFTPASGAVDLEVAPGVSGDVMITVTSRGFIPHRGIIAFSRNTVTVAYNSHVVDDDNVGESAGNGDGTGNPSERIEFNLTLENYGQSETAYGVTAQISSQDPQVNITRNTAGFADLAPGESGSGDAPYLIEVEPDAVNGSVIDIIVAIGDNAGHSWESIIQLPLEAAELVTDGITVIDGGNGIIDPGETFELSVSLQNVGQQALAGANAILRTADDQVAIIDSTAAFGDCGPGETFDNADDTFIVTVAPDIYVGHLINFRLEFEGTGPQIVTASFSEQVGVISSDDPIGPDNYGYYCFDNTDLAYLYHPEFEWISIDLQNWDYVTLGDDDVETISLPFQVQYYGQVYDEISICDNGFVAMGNSWWHAWLNTPIPAPQNAAAMIAPFWDDFVQYNLRVYYNHDIDNSRFVIGWNNAYDEDVYRNQTFEIIILDTAVWPTLTGDNEIIFQYNNIGSVYSTSVGICSPDRRYGIGYIFDDDYAAGAATLVNSRAIKFTTGSDYLTDSDDRAEIPSEFRLAQNYPNPFNASTLIEFALPEGGPVSLQVFNILGQKVATLVDRSYDAGIHQAVWQAADVPSGLYFYRLTAPGADLTKRMTLIK